MGWTWRLSLAATAAFLACGGESTDLFPASDAGGGQDATSDATGQDGSTDLDAGVDTGGPACAPPSDPSKAALCIRFAPEAMQFVSASQALDGRGVLLVQVLTSADGGADAGAGSPVVVPDQPDGGPVQQIEITKLPVVRFDNLPSIVYVRALFVDDLATFGSDPRPGWWLGGFDYTNGVGNAPLKPISLTAGQGREATVDLIALRKLTITLSRENGVNPTGNGQGPATWVAIDRQDFQQPLKLFGLGTSSCSNVSGNSSAQVEGFVIGKGPYFISALLNDYGGQGDVPPGSLLSIEAVDGGIRLPAANRVTYAADAYVITHPIKLTYVDPRVPIVDNVSCP